MRTVNISDPALKPFDSMYSVDRSQWGFTPIPKTGSVFFSRKTFRDDYDAMLWFGGNPSRSIVFRWDGNAYQWLGEQEMFEGPQMWDTPDGRMHERVTIAFYREAVEGAFKGLNIDYYGPDNELSSLPHKGPNFSLKLADVDPFLKKWGFRKH
jgi:hypothetical protein